MSADPKDDENPDVAKPGQWEHVDRACTVCGQHYEPTRTDQRYCSKACRDRRPRQRDKARERARDQRRAPSRAAYFRARCLRRRFGVEALAHTAQALATHTPVPTPLMLNAGPAAVEMRAPAMRLDARPEQQCFIGGTCAECGDVFVAPGLRRVQYCTEHCASKAQRRVAKQRRRARIRAVESEPIKLSLVASRDGWRCHLCKRTVTRETWSLDHLIPLSDGGPHTYVNVALAHHWCNSRRSNTGAAQLRLSAA